MNVSAKIYRFDIERDIYAALIYSKIGENGDNQLRKKTGVDEELKTDS